MVTTEWSTRKQYAVVAQLELGCLPHFESNAASSDLSASCFSGSFPTTPHSGTCITSGSVLKLHLEEMCKQPYLAGQPGLLGEITATPPRSHFFTQCCYCKAQHTWKYFYITGLGKKLKVFSSILCIICTSFWQQNSNCLPDYFSSFNIYVSIGILGNMGSWWT